MSLSKMAQDIVLESIRDQAHDVMGLGELLAEEVPEEGWSDEEFDARVSALSAELDAFANLLELERKTN